jgi:hypothetical protein
MMRLAAVLACLSVLAAVSCSPETEPLTQVMVVVDSSMAQIASVRVRVEGMGDPKTATASDLKKQPLPRTVAVVHRGGRLGPITIIAEALADNGSTLVSRHAELSFVRGRNLMLELELEQRCVGIKCQSGDTCIDGACEPVEVDDLPVWSGKTPKHRDAGTDDPDAGTGEGGGTSGAGGSDSGSGTGGHAGTTVTGGKGGAAGMPTSGSGGAMVTAMCTACEFDSNVPPHGKISCDDGVCNVRCDAGYTNADQKNENGCEKAANAFAWKVSNLDPNSAWLSAATSASITIDCSAELDLGVGPLGSVDICGQQLQPVVVSQSSGPELVVFATKHLQVSSGATFRFLGGRPVVFVVYGDAEIEGHLDVSAIGTTGGPGANTACNPGIGSSGTDDSDHAGGGGGGGFGTMGGSGGTSRPDDAVGGIGGPASFDSSLSPLRGGCPGGAGGKAEGTHASGGGGGGALQISVSGRLFVSGSISAAGGGGAGGSDEFSVFGDGGGGGGSGGAILLEGSKIETVSGAWLTANGGGGGNGRVLYGTAEAGKDGPRLSASPAMGGGPTSESPGGSGAAGAENAKTPQCSASLCGGGGGGGGMGRIVLRSTDCTLAGSASPETLCVAHGT